MQFLGANSDAQVTGGALLPGKVNYFLGSDVSKWHRDLPTYSQISYSNLYSGIDLIKDQSRQIDLFCNERFDAQHQSA